MSALVVNLLFCFLGQVSSAKAPIPIPVRCWSFDNGAFVFDEKLSVDG